MMTITFKEKVLSKIKEDNFDEDKEDLVIKAVLITLELVMVELNRRVTSSNYRERLYTGDAIKHFKKWIQTRIKNVKES